jgi:hypothetical protein
VLLDSPTARARLEDAAETLGVALECRRSSGRRDRAVDARPVVEMLGDDLAEQAPGHVLEAGEPL